MRLAYFVPLHHKLPQFAWLFEAIYSSSDTYVIHVDKKASAEFDRAVRSYVAGRQNVHFLRRQVVNWGGWSQVSVELNAIDWALRNAAHWSYFINLSGQDYPIKSHSAIIGELEAAWPRNFIRAWSFSRVRDIEPDDKHLQRKCFLEIGRRRIRVPLRLPRPSGLDLDYKGSQWHMLTRPFCAWLTRDPLRNRCARWLRWTDTPDEVFFQAMIMNGPFHDRRMADSGREVIWPGPKTLTLEDGDILRESPALYARKFDGAIDRAILVQLAEACGYPIPALDG